MAAASLDADKLRKITGEIIDAITSEEFVTRMNKMRTAPPEQRLETAQKLLSVDGLRAAGVNLPEGMRVSSRYFEQEIGTFEFGNVDIVQQIQKLDSAFVKKLQAEKPEILNRLVADFSSSAGVQCESAGAVVMGACGGAGAGTVCACGGSC